MIRLHLILIVFLLSAASSPAMEDGAGSVTGDSSIEEFYETEVGREYLGNMILQAEQGDALSQYQLGDQYWLGWGVIQDYGTAVKWYTQAAELGLLVAQKTLGRIYTNGDHVERDLAAAIKWYTLAAGQGDADAQETLGFLYASGQESIEDYVEAYKWTLLAGMNGYDVTENKSWLRSHMTSEQVSKAQEFVKALEPYTIKFSNKMEQFIVPEAVIDTSSTQVSNSHAEDESTIRLQGTGQNTEEGRMKYVSTENGFSIYFPSEPERVIIKETTDSKVIHYHSAAEENLVQYNIFIYNFKTNKILDGSFQKAYLQSYLAGRKTTGANDKLFKRELTFLGGNAVVFKQITHPGNTKTIHEGLNFFLDGESIVLTCVYPSSHNPLLSFDEFVKTLEVKIKKASTNGPE